MHAARYALRIGIFPGLQAPAEEAVPIAQRDVFAGFRIHFALPDVRFLVQYGKPGGSIARIQQILGMLRIFDVFVELLAPEYDLARHAVLVDDDIPILLAFPDGHIGDTAGDRIANLGAPAFKRVARAGGLLAGASECRGGISQIQHVVVVCFEQLTFDTVCIAHPVGCRFPEGGDGDVVIRDDDVIEGNGTDCLGNHPGIQSSPIDIIILAEYISVGICSLPAAIGIGLTIMSNGQRRSFLPRFIWQV